MAEPLRAAATPRTFTASLTATPSAPKASETVNLAVTVKDDSGKTVTKFTPDMTKPMHLMLRSRDGQSFQHLHPVEAADGTLSISTQLPQVNQPWDIHAEFTPTGQKNSTDDYLDFNPWNAPAPAREIQKELASQPLTVSVGASEVALQSAPALKANQRTTLNFLVKDTKGNPVTDFTPWLGAWAHLVAESADGATSFHFHLMDMSGGMGGMGGMGGNPPQNGLLPVELTLPAGYYDLELQFARQGDGLGDNNRPAAHFIVNVTP